MSLVKLAWATPGAQTAVQSELGKLKGGIANGWQRSSSAISQHKQHLGNVAELRAAKEHHALQKGKVGESDAVARLEKARAKVHETSNKLRESINPSGKSVVEAARAKPKITPIPSPADAAQHSGGSKVLNFVKNNKIKAGLIGAGVAAAGYGVKKLLEKKQDQPRYYQAG